jgi:hypothetical protein
VISIRQKLPVFDGNDELSVLNGVELLELAEVLLLLLDRLDLLVNLVQLLEVLELLDFLLHDAQTRVIVLVTNHLASKNIMK